MIGYDNERGKGGHKHVGNRQLKSHFTSVEQLVTDSLAEGARVREGG